MKRTLIGAVMFALMAGWTMFSDVFEAVTQLPVIIPIPAPLAAVLFHSSVAGSYVIVWTDYEIITQIAAVCEILFALVFFLESRKKQEGHTIGLGYDRTLGDKQNG